MKKGDICLITDEYITIGGDPSLKGQVFVILEIKDGLAKIEHEQGFILYLTSFAIKKVK